MEAKQKRKKMKRVFVTQPNKTNGPEGRPGTKRGGPAPPVFACLRSQAKTGGEGPSLFSTRNKISQQHGLRKVSDKGGSPHC